MRVFLFLAASALAMPAHASEWIAVTTTSEGDTHYYDSEKLHVEDRAVTFWRKVEFRMPMPVRSAQARLGLYREQIDCASRSLRTLGYLYYTADGAIIEDVYAPEAPPVAIVAATPVQQLEHLLCPLVRNARNNIPPPVGSADGLNELRQEVEALQAQIRKLRRGLELQEAAGSAQ